MASFTIFLLLSCCFASTWANSKVIDESFSFADFIKGPWNVYESSGVVKSGLAPEDGFYFLNISSASDASDMILLLGKQIHNNTETGDISDQASFEFDFEDGEQNIGVYRSGPVGEAAKTLYDFNFRFQTGGSVVSIGKWNGEHPGVYQFFINDPNHFSFTIFRGEDAKTSVFYGSRILHVVEKSLLQRFGPTAILLLAFMLNMYIQRKMKAAPTATATATAATEKKSK